MNLLCIITAAEEVDKCKQCKLRQKSPRRANFLLISWKSNAKSTSTLKTYTSINNSKIMSQVNEIMRLLFPYWC